MNKGAGVGGEFREGITEGLVWELPRGLSRGMIESNLYFKKSVLNTHSPNGTEPEQPGGEEKSGTWMR